MIRLNNVSVAFQGRALFAGVNWQITEASRVALIGVNGSGKSTLLKVIAGRLSAVLRETSARAEQRAPFSERCYDLKIKVGSRPLVYFANRVSLS